MKKKIVLLLIIISGVFLFAEEPKEDLQLELSARFQQDFGFFLSYDENIDINYGPFRETMEFRRIRAYGKGQVGEHIEFKIEVSLNGGAVLPKDIFLRIKDIPFNVTLGHFREPFGLEQLTDSNYITFMERGLSDQFTPSRNTGIMVDGTLFDDMVYLAGGAFREANSVGDVDSVDPTYNFTGRAVVRPFYDYDGKLLIHLGAAASYRDLGSFGIARYAQRPESHMVRTFVDTGGFRTKSVNLLGLEMAAVYGPLSLQGEFMSASMESEVRSDPSFSGFYIQASYWLTGEYRAYSLESAYFERVVLEEPFMENGSLGAIEIAVRYSTINLNDEQVDGGKLTDITFGINWHQTSYTRMMFNYIISEHDLLGQFQAFQFRIEADFNLLR